MNSIILFEASYPDLYYHVAKGRRSNWEPLYGAIITTSEGVEIGDGESQLSALEAFQIAVNDAGLSLTGKACVKSLVWVEEAQGLRWSADAYRIESDDAGGFSARVKGHQSGAFRTLCFSVSLDEAKKTAQADFQQYVISCLNSY